MILSAMIIPCLWASAVAGIQNPPQPPPPTEVAADAIAVSVAAKRTVIPGDEYPSFTVTFRNRSRDYVNLYDVEAYWNWDIRFFTTSKAGGVGGPWRLQFDKTGYVPIAHKQVGVGGSYDVSVDLNDPAYTFEYVWKGGQSRPVGPIRHLPAGQYRVELSLSLRPPFGPGNHQWVGPATANPVRFQVTPARERRPTREELAAWNTAFEWVANLVKEPGGLWINGICPSLDLPKYASAEDVIAMAVNRTVLGSKAYRILQTRDLGGSEHKTAAIVTVGKRTMVALFFFDGRWWSRFYDLPRPVRSG